MSERKREKVMICPQVNNELMYLQIKHAVCVCGKGNALICSFDFNTQEGVSPQPAWDFLLFPAVHVCVYMHVSMGWKLLRSFGLVRHREFHV